MSEVMGALPEGTYLIRGVKDIESLGRWLENLIRHNGGRTELAAITPDEARIRGIIFRGDIAKSIFLGGPVVRGAGVDMHLVKHEEGVLFHIAVVPYYAFSTYTEGAYIYDNEDSNYYWGVFMSQIQTYYKLEPTTERITPTPPPPPKPMKCPHCGRDATYIPQYGRYYCYHCKKYI